MSDLNFLRRSRIRSAARLLRSLLIAGAAAAGLVDLSRAQNGGAYPVLLSISQGYLNPSGADFNLLNKDAETALQNPANLGLEQRFGVGFSDNMLFSGTNVQGLNIASRIGGPKWTLGGLGLSYYQLQTPQAEQRDATGNLIGNFNESERVIKFGLGTTIQHPYEWFSLLSGMSLGANINMYQRQLLDASNGFYTIDVSARYSLGAVSSYLSGLNAGLLVDNLRAIPFGGTSDSLSPLPRALLDYRLLDGVFVVSSQFAWDRPMYYNFGIGYSPISYISLSLMNQNQGYGGGLRLALRDYSFYYNLGINSLGKSQQVGLSMYFGRPDSSMQQYLEGLYAKAKDDADKGNYAYALKTLRRAQGFAPLPDKEKGMYEGLIRLRDANINIMRGSGEGVDLVRRGIVFYLDQKNQMAAEIFKSALFKDPGNLLVQRLLVLAKGEAKEQGSVALPSFTEVDPIQLKLNKAEQYFQDQLWDMALKEIREVIEINPKEVGAYVRMGSVYWAMGLKGKAVQAWKYAIGLNPNHPDVAAAKVFMAKEGLQ